MSLNLLDLQFVTIWVIIVYQYPSNAPLQDIWIENRYLLSGSYGGLENLVSVKFLTSKLAVVECQVAIRTEKIQLCKTHLVEYVLGKTWLKY